jgi:hypothetical protein
VRVSVIAASKWNPFARWFAGRSEARMRAQFGALRVEGLDELVHTSRDAPVLCVTNHSSWWDGLAVLVLSQRVPGRDAYALMDARKLAELRFFALAGGIGVDLDSHRDGARVLRHAATLLDRPGRILWWFPQGAEQPSHAPLRFRAGAARLAQLVPTAKVVPVGLRYRFGASARPEACVSIGSALVLGRARADGPADTSAMEAAVASRLARIDDPSFTGDAWWHAPESVADRALVRALDVVSGLLLRWVGRGPQASIAAHPQLAIAPAHAPRRAGASERSEHEHVGERRIDDDVEHRDRSAAAAHGDRGEHPT